jgi:hypothetical protein
VADYSSPSAFLNKFYDAYRTTEISLQKHKLNGGDGFGDPWYHDGDATLGHGFVYVQYEGPDLGAGELVAKTNAEPDNTVYIGKTGSGLLWQSGPAARNKQEELRWWRYSPLLLSDDEPLVTQKTWSVQPALLDSFFTGITAADRYTNFGLNIDPISKSWGCLSNVGLSLGDIGFPGFTGANKKWYADLSMPSPINRSVVDVVLTVSATKQGKATLDAMDGAVDVIKSHLSGKAWGDTVNIADTTNPNSLTNELYAAINSELPGVYPSALALGLNNSVDALTYFDPSLVGPDLASDPGDEILE